MARPARFTPDGILDAAGQVALDRWRDGTVADVAALLGTPPNSIYYRFATKDALFGALWLRSVQRFHVGLLEALRLPDAHQAAREAAVHIPHFCREHRAEAVAMTLYRQPDLVALVDDPLREQVRRVNDEVRDATVTLARRRFGSDDLGLVELTAVACQEGPYGLVCRHLRADTEMPSWLDDAVAASSAAILALGDQDEGLPTTGNNPRTAATVTPSVQ